MNVISVLSNTPEWMAIRALHDTASEAPAAHGKSKYISRNELLKQKATGITPEVNGAKQAIFNRGHDAEAQARILAEGILGTELYPVTATKTVDGIDLLASLDGATMDEEIIWEHKLYSEQLAASVRAGNLDSHYTLQLDQQLLVSGAKKCLFMTSDGTANKMAWFWYESSPEKFVSLIAGWKQFRKDLDSYNPSEEVVEIIGCAPESLPALRIEVTGMVTASNIAEFKATALSAIKSVNKNLKTDQDFADNTRAIRWCSDIEGRVKSAKEHALSQTSSIDELFRAMDEISMEARTVRLELERLDKTRKESIRLEIVAAAKAKWAEHITSLGSRIGRTGWINCAQPDFATAIKGKKNITSLHEACDTLLAKSKIEANTLADKTDANLRHLSDINAPMFLFSDLQTLATQDAEYFASVVKARITKHAEDEAAKLEAQREAIRKEEAAKIQAQLDADAKREADRLAELARVAREAGQAVQQICGTPVEVIDADGVITQVAANNTVVQVVNQITERSFATARARASTRSLVDNILIGLSESELQRVLTYLQANFAKRAA